MHTYIRLSTYYIYYCECYALCVDGVCYASACTCMFLILRVCVSVYTHNKIESTTHVRAFSCNAMLFHLYCVCVLTTTYIYSEREIRRV